MDPTYRPQLARHVRLTFCRRRQRPILLHPETVVVLNSSGADILELCDGRHTVAEIVAELGARYQTVPADEVRRLLTRAVCRRCVGVNRRLSSCGARRRQLALSDCLLATAANDETLRAAPRTR